MTHFSQKAYAKINLFLHVTGRRDDGYHLLESLVVFTEYGDEITVSRSESDLSLKITGPFSGTLDTGGNNFALKAARLLQKSCVDKGVKMGGAHIHLVKNLPISSGIGGGSADAAATLRALAQLWPQADEIIDSHEFTSKLTTVLGADIMMCLKSKSLIASGIGEKVETVNLPELWLVLVNPGKAISTPEVFGHFELHETSHKMPPLPGIANAHTVADYLKRTSNDLIEPALKIAPVIKDVITTLQQSEDCLYANMSGSGATCFGLYENKKSAQNAANQIQAAQPNWWCIATKTLGHKNA